LASSTSGSNSRKSGSPTLASVGLVDRGPASATRLRLWARQRGRFPPHLSLDVSRTSENTYGVVYEVEGPIKTPSGKTVRFCSIWQIAAGTDVPRFITMYPR